MIWQLTDVDIVLVTSCSNVQSYFGPLFLSLSLPFFLFVSWEASAEGFKTVQYYRVLKVGVVQFALADGVSLKEISGFY